jgi:uncharacterized protein YndB with AHSA1/START domain
MNKGSTNMSTPNDIDRNAPVISHHTISIASQRAKVWALHTDVNAWPSWNTDITTAVLRGPFEVGNSFDWSSHDFPVTSEIFVVEDQHRILWGAPASGIMGIHEWLFDETPGGVTITTTESFAGAPVDAAVEEMQASLDGSLSSWLSQIKRQAEAQ